MMGNRDSLKDKKRIVIKIGSSSLTYSETGNLNYDKLEKLVRILTDLNNQGKEVVLVSSGAIAVGKRALAGTKEKSLAYKQACASIGQSRLMMMYQKLFSEYNQITSQVLMTKYTVENDISLKNATNTFNKLLEYGVIPIVNENDTVSTYEIEFGDNDSLAALVANIIRADLIIMLSDIDGFFTDDPNTNPDAKLIPYVESIDKKLYSLAKDSSSSLVGTGGMAAKLNAAKIATEGGIPMIITNGEDVGNIKTILEGEEIGTYFESNKKDNFNIKDYID